MNAVIIKTHPLTLDTLCDGRVAEQVQAALARIAAAFEDFDLQQGRTKLEGKVSIEIALSYNVDSGAVTVAGKTTTKLPGPRAVGGVAMLRNGSFYVEPDDTQEELFTSSKESNS